MLASMTNCSPRSVPSIQPARVATAARWSTPPGERGPSAGLHFDSDRGCQFTSAEFGKSLDDNTIRQSLSRPGQCWDNAVAESFFSTLKNELVHQHAWPTRARARQAIFEY